MNNIFFQFELHPLTLSLLGIELYYFFQFIFQGYSNFMTWNAGLMVKLVELIFFPIFLIDVFFDVNIKH